MSELLVKGTIKVIGEVQEFGSNGFKSVKWVLEIPDEKYPQSVEFESTQKNAEGFVKNNKVGDAVEVKFGLRGREWTNPQGETKYFNSLNAWFVSKQEGSVPQVAQSAGNQEDNNDLPF